jgi:hypothetical protein
VGAALAFPIHRRRVARRVPVSNRIPAVRGIRYVCV